MEHEEEIRKGVKKWSSELKKRCQEYKREREEELRQKIKELTEELKLLEKAGLCVRNMKDSASFPMNYRSECGKRL